MILVYTKNNLNTAVSLCLDNKRFHVIIACKSNDERNIVIGEIKDCVQEKPGVSRIIIGRDRFEIQFENGSLLKVILASSNSRGYKANLILYSSWIDKEIIDYVLYRMQASYIP